MLILNNHREKLSNLEKKLIKNTLENSNLIAFPTDTIYGIGANGSDKKSVLKLYGMKKREKLKPLILLSYSKKKILKYIKYPELIDNKIINNNWPGTLTAIFEVNDNFPLYYSKTSINTIGIRIPGNNLLLDLLEYIKLPLVTTSANISGKSPLVNGYEIQKEFKTNSCLSIIIDDGEINNNPSRIISFKKDSIEILR